MSREEYLNIDNYRLLHDFLNSVINMIDMQSTEFLKSRGLDHYLIKKVILSTPDVASSSLYSLRYIFFEELEEVSFRENEVTLGFHCYLRPNNQFEIKGAMASIFEEINFHYPTTQELTEKEKESISQLPECFLNLLMRFFEKELYYRQTVS